MVHHALRQFDGAAQQRPTIRSVGTESGSDRVSSNLGELSELPGRYRSRY